MTVESCDTSKHKRIQFLFIESDFGYICGVNI